MFNKNSFIYRTEWDEEIFSSPHYIEEIADGFLFQNDRCVHGKEEGVFRGQTTICGIWSLSNGNVKHIVHVLRSLTM